MQPLNCASLLLLLCVLLAALSPFAATAHRELLMATNGSKGEDGRAKLVRVETAAKDAEERVMRRRKERVSVSCRFRTRKLPSDAKNRFDGRMPFTADYHSVHRHPPKHN